MKDTSKQDNNNGFKFVPFEEEKNTNNVMNSNSNIPNSPFVGTPDFSSLFANPSGVNNASTNVASTMNSNPFNLSAVSPKKDVTGVVNDIREAVEMLKNTGYEEISLSSLSLHLKVAS